MTIIKPSKKIVLSLLACSCVVAQRGLADDQSPVPARPPQIQAPDQPSWQTFDLAFPGGRPRDLVSAIEKSTGKVLNVIITKDDESVEIPAMQFKSITVPDLFRALTMASQKPEQVGGNVYNTYYTFETQGQGENAIFYFKSHKPTPPQKFCRFYQLADALENYS
ncbi:MAG TPA: hypothetical protein VL361_29530, partial [Candidatus Limnocylindrales bacterium]|nr:hypothetical protein [Candidatus Limnocylindrales bacterium]